MAKCRLAARNQQKGSCPVTVKLTGSDCWQHAGFGLISLAGIESFGKGHWSGGKHCETQEIKLFGYDGRGVFTEQ